MACAAKVTSQVKPLPLIARVTSTCDTVPRSSRASFTSLAEALTEMALVVCSLYAGREYSEASSKEAAMSGSSTAARGSEWSVNGAVTLLVCTRKTWPVKGSPRRMRSPRLILPTSLASPAPPSAAPRMSLTVVPSAHRVVRKDSPRCTVTGPSDVSDM